MSKARRYISYILLAAAVIIIGLSVYSFWNAYKIKHVLLEKAGDDPFAMVGALPTERGLGSKTTPDGSDKEKYQNETLQLIYERRRNETAGWISLIVGMLLLGSASALHSWRKGIQTLGISEGK